MEQLYPQNILERHYPVLREQRERQEREDEKEKTRQEADDAAVFELRDVVLYENEPLESGSVGQTLNTIA